MINEITMVCLCNCCIIQYKNQDPDNHWWSWVVYCPGADRLLFMNCFFTKHTHHWNREREREREGQNHFTRLTVLSRVDTFQLARCSHHFQMIVSWLLAVNGCLGTDRLKVRVSPCWVCLSGGQTHVRIASVRSPAGSAAGMPSWSLMIEQRSIYELTTCVVTSIHM